MPRFDRVARLIRTTDAVVVSPVTVNGSVDGVTFELANAPGSALQFWQIAPMALKVDGEDPAPGATIEGEIPQGSLVRLDGILYETLHDTIFASSGVFADTTYAWQSSEQLHWVLGASLDDAAQALSLQSGFAGRRAEVRLGQSGSTPDRVRVYDGEDVAAPGGASQNLESLTISRYLQNSSRDNVGRQIATGINNRLAGASFGALAEYIITYELADNESPLSSATAFRTSPGFDNSARRQIELVTVPGADRVLTAEQTIWCTLQDYRVSETLLGEGVAAEVATVFDSIWIVETSAITSTFDVFIDNEGAAWDIQGIERVDRSLSRIICQRSTDRA